MATNRPFAYNPTHTSVAGTYNIGDLAVGITEQNYNTNPGGLIWWGGPDEEQGYVIAVPVPGNTQPTPLTDNRLYLSSTYKATDIGLSNNKQTATEIFSYQQSVLGETLITTNKVMFSIQFNSTNPSVGIGGRFIGLGKLNMNYEGPFNGYPGNDDKSFGFNDSGQLYNKGLIEDSGFPSWGDGDIIDIAINGDLTTLIWIRVNGGEWNNNSNAHPESDTYGVNFGGYVYISEIYPALCPYIYGSMTIQNYPKYGVPSGYEFLGNTLASVKFLGTKVYPNPLSDSTFISLTNQYFNQSFTGASEASIWLTTNGYWNSYPCLGIATNAAGGLDGFNVGGQAVAFSILPNPAIGTTYPIGSQITFQNGEVRTFVGYDDYGSVYDMFYDSPISSSTLFPITICS